MPNWASDSVVVGGREVVLVEGPKTQTVNVRGADDRKQYEWKIRLPAETVSLGELSQLEDVNQVLNFVIYERGGELEKGATPDGAVPPDPRLLRYSVHSDPWAQDATVAVERAIDSFIDDFVQRPFLHRIEHSIHSRLMHALAQELTLGATSD